MFFFQFYLGNKIMITKKIIASMRVAMATEFEKRADAMARKLGMPTRAQAYARSGAGRTAARRAKLEAAAVQIGTAYHDYVGDLYVSKRGEVSYGKGGLEHRAKSPGNGSCARTDKRDAPDRPCHN